jgi:hypothetical protein
MTGISHNQRINLRKFMSQSREESVGQYLARALSSDWGFAQDQPATRQHFAARRAAAAFAASEAKLAATFRQGFPRPSIRQ